MATRVPKLDLAARSLRKRVKTHENESKKDIKNDSVIVFEENSNVKDWNILFGLIIFRLCNVFLVQTWHVPDEFWQCPEVAHKMVFGYGHTTWEWQEAIRGYVYPLLFAFAYKILDIFHLDFQILIIYLPRIIQALFGACGEYYVYKTAWLLYGARVAWWVLFCQVTSWFMFYCITRTLTNSMETALISIALYYWELSQNLKAKTPSEIAEQTSAIYKALTLASFSCLVRPTALVIWIPLGIARLRRESPVHFFFIYVVPVGICSLIFSVLVDSYFYGKFVLVQYNFLYFNVMKNIGEIYGTHPWHW
jgi:phosphatidylinositol glycan class B